MYTIPIIFIIVVIIILIYYDYEYYSINKSKFLVDIKDVQFRTGDLVFTRYPLAFFTAGVFFEIFEDGMASDETTQLVNCTYKKERNSVIGGIMCNGVQDGYWYGKVDDIFMNLLGYVVGQAIRTTCYPNIIKDE